MPTQTLENIRVYPISQLGNARHRMEFFQSMTEGGIIAGTSAGASVRSDTMLVPSENRDTHRISDSPPMPPGRGLIYHVIIDQYFSEKGAGTGGCAGNYQVPPPQPRSTSMRTREPITETMIEPMQPRRFEKNANITGTSVLSAGAVRP